MCVVSHLLGENPPDTVLVQMKRLVIRLLAALIE